jgi:hypothetical protein
MFGFDAISANIGAIPVSAPYVFGYVTGSSYIIWNQEDFNRFPHAILEYIDQGNGTPWRTPTILDVENGAINPGDLPTLTHKYPGVKVYCNQSTIQSVYNNGYRGWLWVAAPGSAAGVIKTNVEREFPGLKVFAVQDTWESTYDRSTILEIPGHTTPPPPPVPSVNIDGFAVKKPGNGTVPCVIGWWGDDGVVRRHSNIPQALWDQIKWG